MLNLNILKSREDISPLLPVVYLFYLFSWWKDLLCLWSRWCVLLKESAKSYERLWYKFGKKSFVMEFNLPSAEPLSCIRADRTKIGQSSTNCIIAKWNNEWKNAVYRFSAKNYLLSSVFRKTRKLLWVHLVPVYSYHVQDVILAYWVSLMFLTLGQELIFNRSIYHLERKWSKL